MPIMIYGYACVPPTARASQLRFSSLRSLAVPRSSGRFASGARIDRAQLRRALAVLEEGDVLLITRLDRMARSTGDLLNTLAGIGDRKAGCRYLGDMCADTTALHGRLMLTVLGGLAEFERELIRARTSEGHAGAKARGQSLGRPHKLTLHQRRGALRRKEAGGPVREFARSYAVSGSTISRLVP